MNRRQKMIRAKKNIKNIRIREESSDSQEMEKILTPPTPVKSSICCLEHSSQLQKMASLMAKPGLLRQLGGPDEVMVNVATQTEPKHRGIVLCSLAQHKEMMKKGFSYKFNHNESKLAVSLSTIYFTESSIISSSNNALKVFCRKTKTGTPTDPLNKTKCVKNMGTQTNLVSTNIRDLIANKRAFHRQRTDNLYFDKIIRHPPDFSELASMEVKANSFWGFVTPPPGFPVYFREPGKRQKQTICHDNCMTHNESMKAIQEYKLTFVPSNYSELYAMVLLEKNKLSACVNALIGSLKKKERKSSF